MNHNAEKTHCIRGHEFTPENTYTQGHGGRGCKACKTEYDKKYNAEHIEEANARTSKWSKDNPDRSRYIRRRSSYRKLGWTPEGFDAALQKQGNNCAICGKELMGGRETHADHEHCDPPKPRGVLCRSCNFGLGSFHDNSDILRAAVSYLEKYK